MSGGGGVKQHLAQWLRRVGRVANADVSLHLAELDGRFHTPTTIDRALIARHYLRGRGIEIGALHRPLKVSPGTIVDYVDMATADVLMARFPEVGPIREPDIIDNGEVLSTVADNTYDFVIANHFFEHTEDPFSTLKNFVRILRPGGMIFMAIPDKRWTFDQPREITTLEHLLQDHLQGPETSRHAHYRDWLTVIDNFSGPLLEERIAAFTADRVNIHFHVWTIREMYEMFIAAKDRLGIPLEIQFSFANKASLEIIWVLRLDPKT